MSSQVFKRNDQLQFEPPVSGVSSGPNLHARKNLDFEITICQLHSPFTQEYGN